MSPASGARRTWTGNIGANLSLGSETTRRACWLWGLPQARMVRTGRGGCSLAIYRVASYMPRCTAAGFANQPSSSNREDGLTLNDVYISAVCRCAPPDNKPSPIEIANCLPFLAAEMNVLERIEGIIALGRIAFDYSLHLLQQGRRQLSGLQFGHGAFFLLGDGLPWILASYHPSRQNTQTGRLTVDMFDRIWKRARNEIDRSGLRERG